jgi:spore germination protein YaaH
MGQQAPDIMVGGKPIGQKGDGIAYLKFLTILREKLELGKTVSIAAPASLWYLKAFPIDKIANTIDYIVYMTYDLHEQWDYGNKNAFDQCDSGKCIRSHSKRVNPPLKLRMLTFGVVNITETRNTLAMSVQSDSPRPYSQC